jgi:hypothetical protein
MAQVLFSQDASWGGVGSQVLLVTRYAQQLFDGLDSVLR